MVQSSVDLREVTCEYLTMVATDLMHAAARRAAAKPSVSLLIAAVDRDPVRREVWLNETVEDLLHQHNLTAVEVLLLSLVPLDSEPPFVRQVVQSRPRIFKHVHFPTDPGVYGMWNHGWRIGEGEFISTLNLDDRLAHTALAEKAAFMHSHPECDVLSVGVLHVQSVVSFATAQRMGRMAWFNWKRLEWSRPGLFLGSNPQNPPHNSPFWRKTLQYKVGQGGMFREEYDPVADMEMWMRASVQGAAVCHITRPLQTYFYLREFASHNRRDTGKLARTKLQMLNEWRPFIGNRILWLGDAAAVNDEALARATGHAVVIRELQVEHRIVAVQAHTHAHPPPSPPPPPPPPPPPLSPPRRQQQPRTHATPPQRRSPVYHFPFIQDSVSLRATNRPSVPRIAARLAHRADVIVVAPSPHWHCADVLNSLEAAAHANSAATSSRTGDVVLVLPANDGQIDEHLCVGHPGVTPRVDLLLSWGSLAPSVGGLLKPDACIRSLSNGAGHHAMAHEWEEMVRRSSGSMHTSVSLIGAYYALRTGQCGNASAGTPSLATPLSQNPLCERPREGRACLQAAIDHGWCKMGHAVFGNRDACR